MSCPKTKLISAYLDKELGLGEKTAFESHVQGCTVCAQALEELRSLRMAFSKAERHQAPYGFATRVMARTAELEKKKSPWFVPLSIRFAEAAVLLVVITVGILAGKVMTNGSPAESDEHCIVPFSRSVRCNSSRVPWAARILP